MPYDESAGTWNLENSYASLPDVFFKDALPARFPEPRLVVFNSPLAEELGICFDGIAPEQMAAVCCGQIIPNGARSIAQAYAGHQFGGFTMLGDGRAILLGEQRTPDGRLVDIQFKGSGQTPFSRRGDGLAALGPMLREYIISESMSALGIPTTRSLAVVTTGQTVFRESRLQGAVLTRVAASHIRVGTFQYAAARQDEQHLRTLADYTIGRHFPDIAAAGQAGEFEHDARKYLTFLDAVIRRQAALIARWQLVGFIHGVMNTDNMALSGETIDYGPCAFMDRYHPATVFSSIDHNGRYAYGNQPAIGQWNLARFAETLLPLLAPEQEEAIELATESLNAYPAIFERFWLEGMRNKLGLQAEDDGDRELADDLLHWMQESAADFTNTFDDLTRSLQTAASLADVPTQIPVDDQFLNWHRRWIDRLQNNNEPVEAIHQRMRFANPHVIPRNHRVEAALSAATEQADLSVMDRLLQVLATPYQATEMSNEYRTPPPAGSQRYQTFCGT